MSAGHRSTVAGLCVVAVVLVASCGSKDETTRTEPTASSTTVLSPTTSAAPATTVRSPATTVIPTTTAPPITSTTTTSSSTTTTTTPAPATTDPPGSDPGALPQTRDKPSSGSALDQRASALWRAIVADDPSIAMPFFFPKAAYLQVKDIPDAASDYEKRLVAAYEEDIHQLHTKLGANPSSATFTGLTVPTTPQWIDPGSEYNKIGYWRVYGAKLGYTAAGKKQEIAIASMISWRGQWYVVHLNSIR